MSVQITRHRFTVDQYEAMGRAGILGEDDRVELVEGEIVEMTPIGARHAACVLMRSTDLLASRPGPSAYGECAEPSRSSMSTVSSSPISCCSSRRSASLHDQDAGAAGCAARNRGRRHDPGLRSAGQASTLRQRWHPGGLADRPAGPHADVLARSGRQALRADPHLARGRQRLAGAGARREPECHGDSRSR